MAYALYVVHALYFLAERVGGWRSGLRWQLRSRGVYSPDLEAMLRRGDAPRPPAAAVEAARRLVREVCRGRSEGCGYVVVRLAKEIALRWIGVEPSELHVLWPGKPITPAPAARVGHGGTAAGAPGTG